MTDPMFVFCAAASTSAWVVVYVLMIRRGFRDQSYGMPVVALCVNLSWELYFTFLADLPFAARAGNGFFLLFDLGVLYTCLRFGKDDFDWPILKKRFSAFVAVSLPVAFVMVYVFITSFHDYGILSTLLAQLLYSSLFLAMIIRRNSVRGQSFYIGLFILIGDAFGLYTAPYTQRMFQPEVPLAWIYTAYTYILVAHVLYLMLYLHVARRDAINPWRRW